MAQNLRDRGYSSSMDGYKKKKEETLTLPSVQQSHTRTKTTASGTANVNKGQKVSTSRVSTPTRANAVPKEQVETITGRGKTIKSAPVSTMRFSRNSVDQNAFNRSPALIESFGTFDNYMKNKRVTPGGYSTPQQNTYDFNGTYNKINSLDGAMDFQSAKVAQNESRIKTFLKSLPKGVDEQFQKFMQANENYEFLRQTRGENDPQTMMAAAQAVQEQQKAQEMYDQYQSALNKPENVVEYTTALQSYAGDVAAFNRMFEDRNKIANEFNTELAKHLQETEEWERTIRRPEQVEADIERKKQLMAQRQKEREQVQYSTASLKMFGQNMTPQQLEKAMNASDEARRIDTLLENDAQDLALLQEELELAKLYKWKNFATQDIPVSAQHGGPKDSEYYDIINDMGKKDEYSKGNRLADMLQTMSPVLYGTRKLADEFDPANLAEMLPEEVQTYKKIYEQQGRDAALAYYHDLENMSLNSRRRATETQFAKDMVKDSKFLGKLGIALGTSLASPAKLGEYLAQAGDYLSDGKLTTDASYNRLSYVTSAMREQIGEDIDNKLGPKAEKWGVKWGSFGYQTLQSMGDFIVNMAITGGYGLDKEGIALYEQGVRNAHALSAWKAYKQAENLSLALMGTEAAADAVMEAKDRGLSDGQAFTIGTAAGAIEVLTEKVSIENLMEGLGNKNKFLYLLKNMVAEGSEEAASDMLNLAVDIAISKDQSQWRQDIEEYKRTHRVSDSEAIKAVWNEQLKKTGLSALGGALSGGIMAGGKLMSGTNISNYFSNRTLVKSPGYINNVINKASNLKSGAGYDAAQTLQSKLDNGEKISFRDVSKAEMAIDEANLTDRKNVREMIRQAEKYEGTEAESLAKDLRAKLAKGQDATAKEAYRLQEALVEEQIVDPNSESIQYALKQGKASQEGSDAYSLSQAIEHKISTGEKLTADEVYMLEQTVDKAVDEDMRNKSAEAIGNRLIAEDEQTVLKKSARILENTANGKLQNMATEINEQIQSGKVDAKLAGDVFLEAQRVQEATTEAQLNTRILNQREVTEDMDEYDASAARAGVPTHEAERVKSITKALNPNLKVVWEANEDERYVVNDRGERVEKAEGEALKPNEKWVANTENGRYDSDTGTLYLNAKSRNPAMQVVAHEVTHSLEQSDSYDKLQKTILDIMRNDKTLSSEMSKIQSAYQGKNLNPKGMNHELVAFFVQNRLLTDEASIRNVVNQNRTLGERMRNILDDILARFGNKDAQARKQLRTARDLWAKALKESGGLSLPKKTETQSSMSEAENLTLPSVSNQTTDQYGIAVTSDALTSYSITTAPVTPAEIEAEKQRILKKNNKYDANDVERWLKSLSTVSSVVLQNMAELGYESDPRFSWLKTNSEYPQGSVDFNNNCPKRVQFTAVFDRLQEMMPDRVFTASDYETIRGILKKHGIPVTCGPCYVEDRRQHLGEIAQGFIEGLKDGTLKPKIKAKLGNDTFIPNQHDLVTYGGLRKLYDTHRGVHDAFVAFNNARGQQAGRLLEGLAEYDNQIKKWSKGVIRNKNNRGGLRIFSLSDADPRNMIDMIQIVIDSAEKGLMIQGYTKKPWFAKFIKDTGVKMLRSHIPAGNGVLNGKLVFDNVEGINTNDPDYFDATNERNIGDTVIGINDEMIRVAMADKNIDQIIPFHTQLAKDIRKQKQIGHWNPYNGLEDRNVSDGKKADKQVNIYTDVLQAWEQKGTPITNRQEFVEAFLQVCEERGLIPRFDKFLNKENGRYVYTPGYDKFLVDYKLFDRNTDAIIPQETVVPNFDDEYNKKILTDYVKSAKNLPKVSDEVFSEIASKFTDGELSLPSAQQSLTEGEELSIKIADSTDKNGNVVSFTDLILDGKKHGETRNANAHLPTGRWIGIRKNGRVVGRVILGKPIPFTKNDTKLYNDSHIKGTGYDFKGNETKLYYPIEKYEDFRDNPRKLKRGGQYSVYEPLTLPSVQHSQSVSDASAPSVVRRMLDGHAQEDLDKLYKEFAETINAPKSLDPRSIYAVFRDDVEKDKAFYGADSEGLKRGREIIQKINDLSKSVQQHLDDLQRVPVDEFAVRLTLPEEYGLFISENADGLHWSYASKSILDKADKLYNDFQNGDKKDEKRFRKFVKDFYALYQKAGEPFYVYGVEYKPKQSKDGVRYSQSVSDASYLTAVESGDMETAQRMVDEAAKKAGYKTIAYHGTPADNIRIFDGWRGVSYFTSDERYAKGYAWGSENGQMLRDKSRAERRLNNRFTDKVNGLPKSFNIWDDKRVVAVPSDYDGEAGAYFASGNTDAIFYAYENKNGDIAYKQVSGWHTEMDDANDELKVVKGVGDEESRYRAEKNAIIQKAENVKEPSVYRVFIKMTNPYVSNSPFDGNQFSARFNTDENDPYTQRAIKRLQELKDQGYDGVIVPSDAAVMNALSGGDYSEVNDYVVFSPEQVKSADPVTYDDSGKPIPLSERFNPENKDIRYSISKDATLNLPSVNDRAVYIKDSTDANGNPVSFVDLILDGQKLGETRNTRNLPVGEWVGISKGGKNPTVVGRVIFGDPIRITNQSPEYADAHIKGTGYDLKDGESKWYYPIEQVEDFRDNPRKMTSNAPVMGRYQYAVSKDATLDENLGYHAGDLGKAEYLKNQGRSRGTGHFGTGTYFVGTKEKVTEDSHYGKRPQHAVDFSNYNLYKVRNDKDGYRLHDALRVIDGGLDEDFIKKIEAGEFSALRYTDIYDIAKEKFGEDLYGPDYEKNMASVIADYAKQNGIDIQSREEYLKDSEIDEEDADFYYLDYLKETVQKAVDEVNKEYSTVRKAVDNLEFSFHFNRPKIINALNEVLDYQKSTPRFSKSDSYATVFMKAMGYDGVDVRGTGLDNTGYGSVIYDVDKDSILYSNTLDDLVLPAITDDMESIQSDIRQYAGDTKTGKRLYEMAEEYGAEAVEKYIRDMGSEGLSVNAVNKYFAKEGVANALNDYLDDIGNLTRIPGEDKISTGTKQRKKAGLVESGRNIYRKMVDSGEAVGRLGKYTGDPHLYHYYNMARASSNAAVNMITQAQTNVRGQRVGEGLNEIFKDIRAKGDDYYRDLQSYLLHLHNIDRMSRRNPSLIGMLQAEMEQYKLDNPELGLMTDSQIMKLASDPISQYYEQAKAYTDILRKLNKAEMMSNKPVFGDEVTAKVSQQAVDKLLPRLEKVAGFENDVERIYKYIDNLMQYRIDSGLVTEEDYKALKDIYPHYVPTFRIFEDDAEMRSVRDRFKTEIGKTVKRATGGTQKIMPLHRSLANQTFSVVREGSKNRFGQMLLESKQGKSRGMIKNVAEAENDFHEDTFDQLGTKDDPTPVKANTFTVRQDGKRWDIQTDDALYEAVTALSPSGKQQDLVMRAIEGANTLFKELCTGYNPTFLVRNVIRDLQDAGLYSKDLSEFIKQFPQAYKEIAKNGKYYQQYKALGGLYSSVFDYQTGEVKQSKWLKRNTLDRFEALNMALEQAPRLAEFMATVKKAERNGPVTMDTLMEAMYNAADVTVNFGRGGEWGRFLNRNFVPFLNPGIQGFDKMIRNVTETKGFKDWARLVFKATLLGVAPAVISNMLFGKRKDWDEIKDRDKDIYYLFPLNDDGLWLKLPKGRVLSIIGMGADRAMDLANGKDVDWGGVINTAMSQTAPANPLTNNIWQPVVGTKLFNPSNPGETWYGSDIESQRLQNLEPGQRYDATTDALSKWLGKTFNLSPKKISYLLDQYTGVIGDILIPLTSDRAEKDIFTSAFTLDSTMSNRLSEDFYDRKEKATWAKNGLEATLEDESIYKYLNQQNTAVSDINKAIREIEADKTLSDKDKQELVRVQYALRNGIMRNALDTIKDYESGGTDNEIAQSVQKANEKAEITSKTYTFNGREKSWDDLTGKQQKIAQCTEVLNKNKNADEEILEILGERNAKTESANYIAARDAGISPTAYVQALKYIDDFDDGNGDYKQSEVTAGLDRMVSEKKLTKSEASDLWFILTQGAEKNNPYLQTNKKSAPMGLRLPRIG